MSRNAERVIVIVLPDTDATRLLPGAPTAYRRTPTLKVIGCPLFGDDGPNWRIGSPLLGQLKVCAAANRAASIRDTAKAMKSGRMRDLLQETRYYTADYHPQIQTDPLPIRHALRHM